VPLSTKDLNSVRHVSILELAVSIPERTFKELQNLQRLLGIEVVADVAVLLDLMREAVPNQGTRGVDHVHIPQLKFVAKWQGVKVTINDSVDPMLTEDEYQRRPPDLVVRGSVNGGSQGSQWDFDDLTVKAHLKEGINCNDGDCLLLGAAVGWTGVGGLCVWFVSDFLTSGKGWCPGRVGSWRGRSV
jgi:hypothetical protein